MKKIVLILIITINSFACVGCALILPKISLDFKKVEKYFINELQPILATSLYNNSEKYLINIKELEMRMSKISEFRTKLSKLNYKNQKELNFITITVNNLNIVEEDLLSLKIKASSLKNEINLLGLKNEN